MAGVTQQAKRSFTWNYKGTNHVQVTWGEIPWNPPFPEELMVGWLSEGKPLFSAQFC